MILSHLGIILAPFEMHFVERM